MNKATFAQCRYLNTLTIECDKKAIELPEEIKDQLYDIQNLSAQEASELIDALKLELGWRK